MMGTSVREEKSIPQRAQRRREEKIETKKKEKKRGEPPTPRLRWVGGHDAAGHPIRTVQRAKPAIRERRQVYTRR